MEGYLGEIRMFGGNYAPEDWAFCNGQQMLISQYQALYAVIGNNFGGNGTTIFNLPYFRSRVPVHQGQGNGLSPYKIGQQVGSESVVLDTAQIPEHTHALYGNASPGTEASAQGNLIASSDGTELNFAPDSNSPSAVLAANSIGPAGSSQAHPNIQPSMAVSFIICVNGAFPVRP